MSSPMPICSKNLRTATYFSTPVRTVRFSPTGWLTILPPTRVGWYIRAVVTIWCTPTTPPGPT